jgi:hypothetical protein
MGVLLLSIIVLCQLVITALLAVKLIAVHADWTSIKGNIRVGRTSLYVQPYMQKLIASLQQHLLALAWLIACSMLLNVLALIALKLCKTCS